jgi:hypothetical protein
MTLKLILLCLIAAVLAAPSPQMGAGLGNLLGGSNLSGLMGKATGAFSKMAPLPLYKTVTAQPESKRPGVIREQLYYGPLILKPAAVRSYHLNVTEFKVYNKP